MELDAVSAALRRQSEYERSRGNLDYADALLEADGVYKARGCDYWTTIATLTDRIVDGRRMDLGVCILRARDVVRREWRAPAAADPTTRRLYGQSEQERTRGRLDEADAFLEVADVYEATSRDYGATLRRLATMGRDRRLASAVNLLTATDWFRGVWTESPKAAAPTVADKAKPAKGRLFGR